MSYKRNQIEEAIVSLIAPPSEKAHAKLLTRIKRLLETDRKAKGPVFGFFTGKAPGTGADVLFSEYEAFALLNALRIMEHAWAQGFAVSIMRRVRADLEREHARILKQSPDKLFDQQAIFAKARPGDMAFDNSDPVFLTLASKAQGAADNSETSPVAAVCHGMAKVGEFSSKERASSVTLLEVATLAHGLHEALQQTEPKHRGRG
jgi:hypothetical protein